MERMLIFRDNAKAARYGALVTTVAVPGRSNGPGIPHGAVFSRSR
jgi:hypothetical protein